MSFQVQDHKLVDYKQVIVNWIKKSDDGTEESQEKIALTLSNEFEKISTHCKLTFGFIYTKNKENELRGRVGKFAGWRTGTRDLSLIPDNQVPKGRSTEVTCIRYYDFGRHSWRSFKRDLFVVATSFYNETDKKWYDNPEQANAPTTWNQKNNDFTHNERTDTEIEKLNREKVNKKEKEKREKQIELMRKKQDLKNMSNLTIIKKSNFWKSLITESMLKNRFNKESKKIEQPVVDLPKKGCLMLRFKCPNLSEIQLKINKEDLYNDETLTYGFENEPHVTILYGFLELSLDVDSLESFVQTFTNLYVQKNNQVQVNVGILSIFQNEKYDVLKFNIHSNFLNLLNSNVKALFPFENKFSDYQPHMTIAYLKPGTASKYIGKLPFPEIYLEDIFYSTSDRQQVIFYDFN